MSWSGYIPGDLLRREEEDVDLRTTEEIEDDAEAEARAARVFVTGFPARPGTIR